MFFIEQNNFRSTIQIAAEWCFILLNKKVRYPIDNVHDIILTGTTIPALAKEVTSMCETIFTTIIAPLLVGIILLLIQKWLDDSAD